MFSVWEKDAKDESGFVGYCYLDLFPRGMHIDSIRHPSSDEICDRIQVLARGSVAAAAWVPEGRRVAQLPARRDGGEPGEADAVEAGADAARRRGDVLPRDGARLPQAAESNAVRAVSWDCVNSSVLFLFRSCFHFCLDIYRLLVSRATLWRPPHRCSRTGAGSPAWLKKMSRHYETGKPLSAELIEKLVKRCLFRSQSQGVCVVSVKGMRVSVC